MPFTLMQPGTSTWVAGGGGAAPSGWAASTALSTTAAMQWRTGSVEDLGQSSSAITAAAAQAVYTFPVGRENYVNTVCVGITVATGTVPGSRWLLILAAPQAADPNPDGTPMHWSSLYVHADPLNWEVHAHPSGGLDITWLGLGSTPTLLYVPASIVYRAGTHTTGLRASLQTFGAPAGTLTTTAGLQFVQINSTLNTPSPLLGAQDVNWRVNSATGRYEGYWQLPPLMPTGVRTWEVRNMRALNVGSNAPALLPVAGLTGLLNTTPSVVMGAPVACGGCPPLPYVVAPPLPGAPQPGGALPGGQPIN